VLQRHRAIDLARALALFGRAAQIIVVVGRAEDRLL